MPVRPRWRPVAERGSEPGMEGAQFDGSVLPWNGFRYLDNLTTGRSKLHQIGVTKDR